MKIVWTCGIAAVLAYGASGLAAQTKTITGETKTVTATVEAIEPKTRAVTVKKPDGTFDVLYVPDGKVLRERRPPGEAGG